MTRAAPMDGTAATVGGATALGSANPGASVGRLPKPSRVGAVSEIPPVPKAAAGTARGPIAVGACTGAEAATKRPAANAGSAASEVVSRTAAKAFKRLIPKLSTIIAALAGGLWPRFRRRKAYGDLGPLRG